MCQDSIDPISLESKGQFEKNRKKGTDGAEWIWWTGHRHWWGNLLGGEGWRMTTTICAVCRRWCPVGGAVAMDKTHDYGSYDQTYGDNSYPSGFQL